MRVKTLIRPALQLLFTLCVLCSVISISQLPASAGEPVIGRYLQSSGNTIKLQLNISSPAPQNLILEQYLPLGTKVLSTSPKARKVNSRSGVVKWLFKGVSPGVTVITMQVSPAAATRAVNGILRYRIAGGAMTEKRISR